MFNDFLILCAVRNYDVDQAEKLLRKVSAKFIVGWNKSFKINFI